MKTSLGNDSALDPFGLVSDVSPDQYRVPTRSYSLPFSKIEYEERLERCRREMEACGIDLLLVTSPEGMCYLHGYEVTWYKAASTTHWCPTTTTVIHVDHNELILFDGEDSVPSAANRRLSIDNDSAANFGTRLSVETATRDFVKQLSDIGWLSNKTRVGLELWSYIPPPAVSKQLTERILSVGGNVLDGSRVMKNVRKLKSAVELDAIRHAAKIADIGLRAVATSFQPGMSHGQVYAEAMYAMLNAGGEIPGIPQAVQPGWPQSTHLLPSRRQISAGEPFAVDVAGVFKRYHANLDRTFIWGEPSKVLCDMNRAAMEALEVLACTAKAGTSVGTVSRALRAHYIESGIWEYHHYCGGYELGIAFPPDWVGEFEWSVDDDNCFDSFEENMVTNYENSFRNEDLQFEFAQIAFSRDTLIYTANGAERLSTIPVDLIVMEN